MIERPKRIGEAWRIMIQMKGENYDLKQRITELEEEKPEVAEIIELRKAVNIYSKNGEAYRAKIAELQAVVDNKQKVIDIERKAQIKWELAFIDLQLRKLNE